ncbi:MAG: DUF192 domain-containing protein [Betaproteobacteria bacterium]|nr:DUF192 domain-containing protein [Betaproteobacteria bacterium]
MRPISALVGAVLLTAATARAQQPPLPEVRLGLGMHVLRAEVADRYRARMEGLTGRRSMPQSHGMLFVFDRPDKYCMWMKNTLIPLSVAFIDEGGRIINVADMRPQTEEPHCAAGAARYALEMNRGWFAQRGIGAGAQLSGLEKLRR